MISVEFYDFDFPTDHTVQGNDYKWRSGKLLQIARNANKNDNDYMAFVIVPKMAHDRNSMPNTGDKIILPVKLSYVRVKGTSIPLFGS